MTWTRPPDFAAEVATPRLWHYAASRSPVMTVALCGAEWPTGRSEAKEKTGPSERCEECEALRKVLHASPASKARIAMRSRLRREVAARAKEPFSRTTAEGRR